METYIIKDKNDLKIQKIKINKDKVFLIDLKKTPKETKNKKSAFKETKSKNTTNFKRKRNKKDKILDNNYNMGLTEFEQFGPVQILTAFELEQLSSYYEAQEYYHTDRLINLINELWNKTTWEEQFGKLKKIPKQYLSEIYTYLVTNLANQTYSNCEIFVNIADFLDINYKTLYEMIPPIYKIKILKELDEKYKIFNKNKFISSVSLF